MTVVPADGPETLVVTTFRLRRPYRPDLWDEALAEVEVVARDLAASLGPDARLSDSRTRAIAGARARVYDIPYQRDGEQLLERTAFLFRGSREYQLTCRIDVENAERGTTACRELYDSFEIVRLRRV